MKGNVGAMRTTRIMIVLGIAASMAVLAVASVRPPGAQTAEGQTKAPAKHPLDAWLEECTAKDESTVGQIACLTEAGGKWDAELNRVYKALMARLPEAARPALKAAQLAWIQHRDREFELLAALYDSLDGTMYGLMKAADRVDVVRKRALELSSYLDVLENL